MSHWMPRHVLLIGLLNLLQEIQQVRHDLKRLLRPAAGWLQRLTKSLLLPLTAELHLVPFFTGLTLWLPI